MSDLFGIAASGVNAYRDALAVVGDNVANADTAGFVRRRIELKIAAVGGAGNPTDRDIGTGSGVAVAGLTRAYDALKTAAARDAGSDLARVATRGDWLTRLQSTLGSGDASLAARVGGFFDAAQDLASSPASPAARTIFLDRADQTAAAFRGTAAGLDGLGSDIAAATGDAVAVDGLADRFAAAANAQHAVGVDLAGADGTALFATTTLGAVAGRANGGNAAVDVALADAASIAAGGYVLGYDGAAWTLARSDGSASVSGAGPLTLDGVTVTTSGAPQAGDRFALTPRAGAAGIVLRPLAPAEVAAASRWLSDADGANSGSGRIAVAVDPAAAALPALPAYRIVVTGAASADIIDPATGTVLATAAIGGSSIAGAGFSFALAGAPAVGDAFRITRNAGGVGDNGNVRALAALRGAAGAGGTIEASLDATVTGIASTLSETNKLAASLAAVRDDAARAADAVGGVDLDQEAATLTRLQAAYNANAQVIAAARDLFDTLLRAVA